MLGRRGAGGLFTDARSSAGAFPTTRLLQGRWVRRGRTSHLRSLLLRRHVDEDDEDLVRADAGSGSHNLDAPLPGAPKMSGEICLHEHLWGPSPFLGSAGGGGRAKSGLRRCTQGVLPSFGPHGCVKPYCCFVVCIVFLLGSVWCYSTHELLARESVAMGVLLLLRAHGASFYMLKGLPTGGSAGGGKNGRML